MSSKKLEKISNDWLDVLIGKNLDRIMSEKGLDRNAFLELTKLQKTDLSSYISGSKGVGKTVLKRLCRDLNVRPVEFYREDWLDEISNTTTKTMAIPDDADQEALDMVRKVLAIMASDDDITK